MKSSYAVSICSLLCAFASADSEATKLFSPPTMTASFTSNLPHDRRLHVRMVGANNKLGATPLPIRNARTAGANGAASVAGACGGAAAYKAAGAAEVPVGSKVTLSLQYAAGHESPNNVFVATFRCGAPTQNQMKAGTAGTTTLTAAECTTTAGGNAYPVPAPTGRDAKVIECTLPTKTAAELAGAGGQCSLSFQDQRDWGGCVDIKYAAAAAVVPGQPPAAVTPPATPTAPTPPQAAISSTTITSIVTSGGPPKLPCCGLATGVITATPGRTTALGDTTLRLSGTATGTQCSPGLNFPQNSISMTINDVILFGKIGSLSFKNTGNRAQNGEIMIGGIPAQVEFINNVLTFEMLGPASQNPTVCDAEMLMGGGPGGNSLIPEVTPLLVSTPSTGANAGGLTPTAVTFIVIAVVVVLLALLVVVAIQKKNKDAANQPTPTPAIAISAKAVNNNGTQLKAGWSEAKDGAGDVYYYNKTTGETTWERNLVVV